MPQDRIHGAIDDHQRVRLKGSRPLLATPPNDIGAADPSLPMDRMILVLQPDADQQTALAAMLDALNDPASTQYHHWLTPQEYARHFGVSPADLGRASEWLTDHGFTVEDVPAGAQSIVFSGTAAQVESAFHTSIRKYRVDGRQRVANATEVSIPAALASVVAGPVSLHNFPRKALHHSLTSAPQYTYGGSHALGAADFATIYDLNALYNSSINGSGEVIGIVGRINIRTLDIQEFRSTWGLPANNPTVIVNGADPGIYDINEEAEADLDVEWSGAVAPQAAVKFVVSASTNTTDGVDLSAQYIVSHNLASVMSTSFGSCEAAMGPAERAFYANLWSQAAAEGITAFIAAGDSGAAGCDGGSESTASYGQAVNGLCSSVSSVCVGGTEFNENGNNNLYWSATNNAATQGSALSYIPEVAWNESGTVSGGSGLWATGGGASGYYAKPSWQTGTGVPNDNRRDVPDLSVTAAAGHDPYWVVILDNYYTIGGTSAASPSMAGIMALVDQKNGGRQGNANTKFYALAAAQDTGGAQVFHGTTGGNNRVPGAAGFTATEHYNQATGLGSPDGFVLANHWTTGVSSNPTLAISTSTASLSLIPGASGTVTATVAVGGGFSASVTMTASGLTSGVTATLSPATLPAPGSGTSTVTISAAATAAVGAFTVTLTATGAGQTKTTTVAVTVARPFTVSAGAATISLTQGTSSALTVTTANASGFSGIVTLTASGHSGVTAAFSPASIAAPGAGTSTLHLAAASNATPGSYTLTLTGTSGSTAETATVAVTIAAAANFTLSLPASALAVAPGGGGSLAVTVVSGAGFNASVTLAASGAHAGLTVSFGGNKMTVQAASNLATGSYPVTITGTANGLSAAPVTAIINVGTFSLAVPASVAVTRGHSSAVMIHTAVTNGYNVPVALTVSGTSGGLAGSFSPPTIATPASGSSTLTLVVSAAMTTGSVRLNVMATSDGVTVTAPLTVLVQ